MAESILSTLKSDDIVGPERHRFRLLSSLGEHPYGSCWKAEDLATSSKTEVMLLFLPDVLSRQQSCVEELRKLVILARKCKHPNALDCYGLFSHKGAIFVAFESIDGLTLAKMLDNNQAQKLKPEQKQGLVIQIGKALDAFHRDTRKSHSSLSPELIFISSGKGVRVMMLGWRHIVDEFLDLIPGEPRYRQYQAPEGFDPLPTTQKSDLYAFAAMIYHLYSGKSAFLLNDDEKSRFQRELKAPTQLDEHQWQYLQAALSPDQDTRPTNAMVLLKQLYALSAKDSEADSDEQSSVDADTTDQTNEQRSDVEDGNNKSSDHWLISKLPSGLIKPFSRLSKLTQRFGNKTRMLSLFLAGLLLGLLISLMLRPNTTQFTNEILRLENELSSTQTMLEALQQQSLSAPVIEESPESAIETDDLLAENNETPASYQPVAAQPTTRQTLQDTESPESLIRFQDFFGESGVAPMMQELPQGEFLMGDLNRIGDDNERPVREIIFEYRFAIGVHEVTFAEYDQFAEATGRELPDDAGWGRGDRPVINVSWEDARDYARWLRDVTGQPYRLPSEAEWEYAARAGTGSAWWWGNELEPGMAVCDGCGTQWDGQQTAPVGQLPANAWGLQDMHGNVEEWVEDCYSDHYTSAPEDGSAMHMGNCNLRVLRGGSWFDIPRVIRSSSRYRQEINLRQHTFGFRVAVDLHEAP